MQLQDKKKIDNTVRRNSNYMTNSNKVHNFSLQTQQNPQK